MSQAEYDAARRAHLATAVRALRRHRGGCVLSHEAAAIGLRLPTYRIPRKVLLTRDSGSRRTTGRTDVAVAALPAAHLAVVDIGPVRGVPLTSMARTVVDIGRTRPFLEALVTADAALRRGLPRQELLDVLAQMPRWPGTVAAAEVVRWADGRSESPAESVTRGRFILLGLPMPEPQVRVPVLGGGCRRVDFLWKQVGLIVEVDGKVKYEGPEGEQELWQEKQRRDDLEEELTIIRWNWRQSHAPDAEFCERFWRAWARAERLQRAR
jgi:hypothetical protein